jgi:hypothetical protein
MSSWSQVRAKRSDGNFRTRNAFCSQTDGQSKKERKLGGGFLSKPG